VTELLQTEEYVRALGIFECLEDRVQCVGKPSCFGKGVSPHSDCRRFCAEKASNFNKSQQLSPSGSQQFQYQSIKSNQFQQSSLGICLWFGTRGSEVQILSPPTHQSLPAGHHLTINVTGILTGCTLELELVAVTVIVKVPGGVPGGGGGGGGGVEPPPQPMQSSTANAPVAKTQRGMCLLALSR